MFVPGLVSISFRNLSPAELIRLCVECRLPAIEWGGDVHVPHGDLARGREVAAAMDGEGLNCSSYGSYYRAAAADRPDFRAVADTAAELGAPTIRVWAGIRDSEDMEERDFRAVADDLRNCCRIAAERGLTVTTEYHRGTAANHAGPVLKLLAAVDHPALRSGWQPPIDETPAERLAGLKQLLPYLSTLHVFHWRPETERQPLADGAEDWRCYFRAAAAAPGDHPALLEFVRHDSPEQLRTDAATLLDWLAGMTEPRKK